MMERLQKVIAAAGICSRRRAEELILAGRLSVNGKTVTQLGTKVDVARDHVLLDGKRLKIIQEKVYLLLNKPKGYVCTLSDPEGRPTVKDLIQEVSQRIYPVGRLDFHSEGLLVLTNDGEFANLIASAGEHCPKTYWVKVRGIPSSDSLGRLSKGIRLDGHPTAPCRIRLGKQGDNPWFEVTLIEGRNNQIRKMFERIGHPVQKLKRTQIGFLRDDKLRPSEYRSLTYQEVERFKRLATKRPGTGLDSGPSVNDHPRPFRKKVSKAL
jgi:23S rRNA pseudouridine2605 synthase